ncbi:histidine phosphatase family protein [Microbulbifer echini]|uniref:Histidine phosphatase family protein n=1 Tax=Microbulbifer echini TaxID=1529067 RepID=A0ABV4NJQ3_9GAMM
MFTRIARLLTCIAIALPAVFVWAEAPASQSASQVIYLVRHGEKQRGPDTGSNPNLSEQGQARARQLAWMLEEVGIDAIYSTDYIRTKETARPLAELRNLSIQTYDPRKLKELAEQLSGAGDRILVVGHSNTTPQLVALLGGQKGKAIRESDEYDRLYIVIRDRDQVTTLLQRYGADSTAKPATVNTKTP